VFRRLLTGPGQLLTKLFPMRTFDDIGPASFLDAAKYAAIRALDGVSESLILLEAFTAYLLPQLGELDPSSSAQLLAVLDDVLAPAERSGARVLLSEFGVLGVAA